MCLALSTTPQTSGTRTAPRPVPGVVVHKDLVVDVQLVILQEAVLFRVSAFHLEKQTGKKDLELIVCSFVFSVQFDQYTHINITFLMNFLSSALHSRVFLEKSSVTSIFALLRTLDCFSTVSRSLNVSNATRTGRQPRTSGPEGKCAVPTTNLVHFLMDLVPTTLRTCVDSGRPEYGDFPPDVEVIPQDAEEERLQTVAVLVGLLPHAVEDEVVFLVLLKLVHFFLE